MGTARGFLGSGDLYINRQSGGVYSGWVGPFECEQFEIKANSELREKVSKGKATYGQIVASASIPKPFDLNITLGEADKTGMAIALLGNVSAVTQIAGSLTAVTVVGVADVWVPLTKQRLTGSQTVTNAAASTTYVLGTDYLIEKEMGWIKVLSTGSIGVAAATLKLTSTYAAITGDQIAGATNSSVIAQFRLSGKNLADDTPAIVNVAQAVVASQAAVDFMADQFATIPLSGRMVTPSGFTEPFTVQLLN
jgi:hypothetical protein